MKANKLVDSVPTDETILWTDIPPPSWWGRNWYFVLIVVVLACSVGLAYFDVDGLFSLSIIPVVFLLLRLLFGPVGRHNGGPQTILTDRRVLHLVPEASIGSEDGIVRIPLANVLGVGLLDFGNAIGVRIDRPVPDLPAKLATPRPQELAAAVADATNLGRPGQIGRLEHLNFASLAVGWLSMIALLGALLAFDPLETKTTGSALLDMVVVPATLVSLSFLAFVVPMHLSAIAAFLLMPRYASMEEAGHWLGLKPTQPLFQKIGLKSRPYVWLARLRYGDALRVSAEQSG